MKNFSDRRDFLKLTAAGAATLKINGVEIELELPAYSHELGGTGVWAPVGVYSR